MMAQTAAATAASKEGEWFTEEYLGFNCSLKVKEVLHQERSKYQDILIYERYSLTLSIGGQPFLLSAILKNKV